MSCDAETREPLNLSFVVTGMSKRIGALILMAAVLVSCGSLAGSGGDPSPTAPRSVMVTKADDRGTVTAHVGDLVQIALGDQFSWQLDPPDGVVLARPAVQNYLLVRGTQAIWLAKAAGTATVRATGGAVCPSGQPCPLFAVLFSVTVNVLP